MAEEKEKEENIWRRKISFFVEKRSRERKYLLKENMFKWRSIRAEKEKEENIWWRRRRMEVTEEKCKRSSWTQNVSHRACSAVGWRLCLNLLQGAYLSYLSVSQMFD